MVFGKEYIVRCSSAEWIGRNGCDLRWCHRGEETVGFPEWTAQFCVWKTTGKDSSEDCAITCQNCAVYSVFPSGMTSQSKIAQFNWECRGRFRAHVLTTEKPSAIRNLSAYYTPISVTALLVTKSQVFVHDKWVPVITLFVLRSIENT